MHTHALVRHDCKRQMPMWCTTSSIIDHHAPPPPPPSSWQQFFITTPTTTAFGSDLGHQCVMDSWSLLFTSLQFTSFLHLEEYNNNYHHHERIWSYIERHQSIIIFLLGIKLLLLLLLLLLYYYYYQCLASQCLIIFKGLPYIINVIIIKHKECSRKPVCMW